MPKNKYHWAIYFKKKAITLLTLLNKYMKGKEREIIKEAEAEVRI
jgi:hypothetical protein